MKKLNNEELKELFFNEESPIKYNWTVPSEQPFTRLTKKQLDEVMVKIFFVKNEDGTVISKWEMKNDNKG